ncbi:hypothetical protein BU24DRAFT_195338 [Aaosphaeria arxii CBS 175.79]|uniref:Uncharacterized protein n=1 Tax=Aaosphaeria arxii CBS 175.79 TaxID=1450172 RepID=A0A6A5XU38_9PLEO|nr:uncharacterized protein BU24DRAFT_195338 [Aaosphaeria arxii CBS 175.79]KAF2016170.1 hypothetical protein BU24DRAFT_195338 [Aaosphaeria arxii CBS 175.79]
MANRHKPVKWECTEPNSESDNGTSTDTYNEERTVYPPEPTLPAMALPSTATLNALSMLDRPRRPSPPPKGSRVREPDSPTLLAKNWPSTATLNELSRLDSLLPQSLSSQQATQALIDHVTDRNAPGNSKQGPNFPPVNDKSASPSHKQIKGAGQTGSDCKK